MEMCHFLRYLARVVIPGLSIGIASFAYGSESVATSSVLPFAAEGSNIVVFPGTIVANGTTVTVSTTATLAVAPAETVAVKDEATTPPDQLPHMWQGGNLRQVRTANAISGSFMPESLKVRLEDGTLLQRDKDYLVDDTWASISRTPDGRITTGAQVYCSYEFSLMRLDGIDVAGDGTVQITTGTPHLVCPKPPPGAAGSVRIANVFRPYKSATVELWQIFPVSEPFAEPTREEQVAMSQPVRRTLQKLRNGEAVTIVTWGDSVTVGGDASRPELAYANLFISRLRERFPGAHITHVNAGIGGTNTSQRLPDLQKEVLAHDPDLVTIEFVNDMAIPVPDLRSNWNKALNQIKESGAEAVIITPHFTSSFIAMGPYPRGGETRPQVSALKALASENGVGLADTSQRWAHLEKEGIPYVTLLYNGINHPNDYGHELFVKDLVNLFPEKD